MEGKWKREGRMMEHDNKLMEIINSKKKKKEVPILAHLGVKE